MLIEKRRNLTKPIIKGGNMKFIRFIKNILKYQQLTKEEKSQGERIYTLVMAMKEGNYGK